MPLYVSLGPGSRNGPIEVWDRGTNRWSRRAAHTASRNRRSPEASGAVTGTFKVDVVAGAPRWDQAGTKLGLSRNQAQVLELAGELRTHPEVMGPSEARTGPSSRTTFSHPSSMPACAALRGVLTAGETYENHRGMPNSPSDELSALRSRVAELEATIVHLTRDLADARAEAELADNMLRRRDGWRPVTRDWSRRSRR